MIIRDISSNIHPQHILKMVVLYCKHGCFCHTVDYMLDLMYFIFLRVGSHELEQSVISAEQIIIMDSYFKHNFDFYFS